MISGHEDTVADIDSDRNRICAVFLVVRDGVQEAVFVFFADPGTFVCIEVQEPSALPQRSQIVRFHSHCVKDPDIGESNEDLVIFISCRLVFSIIEPGLVIEFDQLFRQVITAVIDVSLPERGVRPGFLPRVGEHEVEPVVGECGPYAVDHKGTKGKGDHDQSDLEPVVVADITKLLFHGQPFEFIGFTFKKRADSVEHRRVSLRCRILFRQPWI